MHVLAIVIFIVGVLVQGRVEPFEELPGRGFTYAVNDGAYGIIIDARYAPRFFSDSQRETIEGYWTPTVEDIARVEKLLRPVRADDVTRTRERARENAHLAGRARVDALVSRQYAGFVADGTRFVEVIGFCNGGLPNDPLARMVVSDGGACYWNALIDADSWAIERYVENGHA